MVRKSISSVFICEDKIMIPEPEYGTIAMWLSPEGEIVKADSWGHWRSAQTIIEERFPDKLNWKTGTDSYGASSVVLETLGWAKIGSAGMASVYINNSPTSEQLEVLYKIVAKYKASGYSDRAQDFEKLVIGYLKKYSGV